MTKQETVDKLASSRIIRHDREGDAFDAFVRHMRRFQYGRPETAQAYHFFVAGWFAKEGRPLS